MTVAELIEFLKTQPQDIIVAFEQYSEWAVMDKESIQVVKGPAPRADGWIHTFYREKDDSHQYLLFPGN